jgi:GNAT superfamily N-acetyltransferase
MVDSAPLLVARVERYDECIEEMKEIFPDHWRELASDPDIELAPRYDLAEKIDAAGSLLLVTLRAGEKLAGYFLATIAPGLHYEKCLTCTTDIFYVLPEYRDGTAGRKLFREAERELVSRGVKRWYAASKLKNDCGPMLRRFGFEPIDMNYRKRLDRRAS